MFTSVRLREVLDYNSETGIFKWKVRRGRGCVGMVAGSPAGFKKKYLEIKVDHHRCLAHRLAWFYVYGEWPKGRLDHIDTNERNNAIKNLREATAVQSMANRNKAYSNKLYKGVRKRKHNYSARIVIRGQDIHLGCFDTAEEAHKAYLTAAKNLFGEFARG